MSEYNIKVTDYPVRVAQLNEKKFILFHTRNFNCIHLDKLSFEIWNFIKRAQAVNTDMVCQFVDNYDSTIKEKGIDIRGDIEKFETFLIEKGLIERINTNG